MMMDRAETGRRIRSLRLRRHMRGPELAKAARLSVKTLMGAETGPWHPDGPWGLSEAALRRVVDVLGVSMEEFEAHNPVPPSAIDPKDVVELASKTTGEDGSLAVAAIAGRSLGIKQFEMAEALGVSPVTARQAYRTAKPEHWSAARSVERQIIDALGADEQGSLDEL